MSRHYELKLGEVSGESVDKRDLQCPPIVPEMPQLLGDALAARGWTVKGGKARKSFGGVEAEVNLKKPSLGLKARATEEVVGRGYDAQDNESRGMARAREDGEKKKKAATRTAKARADKALLEAEPGIRAEALGAVAEALTEALSRKASELGRVQGIDHSIDAEGREVTTIRVEV